jgi:hypothetical protein
MNKTPFNGKGSWQRPVKDKKQFEDNWDRIFGGKHEKKTQPNGTVETANAHATGSGDTGQHTTGPADTPHTEIESTPCQTGEQ